MKSNAPTVEIQTQMVVQFSAQSGMKPDWSRKCLEDNSWDFSKAGDSFLFNRANIPQEAFI